MAGFRFPHHWTNLDKLLVPDFIALQEDRDRALEDYLNNLVIPAAGGTSAAAIMVAANTGTAVNDAVAMTPTWQTADVGNPDTFNIGAFFTQPNATDIAAAADCFVQVSIYIHLQPAGNINYAQVAVSGPPWAPAFFRVPPDSGATDITPAGSFMTRMNAASPFNVSVFQDTGVNTTINEGFFGITLIAKA